MASAETLPVLYIRAKSHYDVGFVMGKSFKGWIQDYLKVSTDVKKFRDFYATSEGKALTAGYLATAKSCYPQIMSEMQGMAKGSETTFEDIFLLQLASEILFCHYDEVVKKLPSSANEGRGCTDVLMNRKNARIIGHNDDWVKDVAEKVFLSHVTITTDDGNIVEQFVTYCYPGYLAGFCFSMNRNLVITLNSLSPKTANTKSVPVSILMRALLAQNTIEKCVAVMENKPLGSAYGMCIDIASIDGTEMCSMEVYTNEGKTEINLYKIPHESENPECFYCHQNYYKQIKALEADWCRGSKLRDQRARELFPPKDLGDILTILGDTKEEKEPIYRKPDPVRWSPDVETSGTAIFDITNKKLYVYRSNPKTAKSPCVTMPFL